MTSFFVLFQITDLKEGQEFFSIKAEPLEDEDMFSLEPVICSCYSRVALGTYRLMAAAEMAMSLHIHKNTFNNTTDDN